MAGLGHPVVPGEAENVEVDDYMADLSIFVPVAEEQLPIKPQALQRGKKGQKVPWQKKREEKEKGVAETEDSLRNNGLKLPIPDSNIGFKMLQKMGYTPSRPVGIVSDLAYSGKLDPGSPARFSAGRSGSIASGLGRLEPVEVDLKRGRGGLGRDEVVKEEKKKKTEKFMHLVAKKQAKHRELEVGYAERRRGQWEGKKLERSVLKARSALRQLEEAEGGGQAGGDAGEKEGEVEEEVFSEEMLDDLLARLRGHFLYCIHCGCKFDSQLDMEANCPGEDEDDH